MSDRVDTVNDNPLIQADRLQDEWYNDLNDFMNDKDFTDTLDLVLKCIDKPNVPQQQVAVLCVRLQAYATKFRLMFATYMGPYKGTTEANAKKNMYKEFYSGIDRLVDSLKYLVRN